MEWTSEEEENVVGENQVREWRPFIGPFDPCPPIRVKTYVVPPNQFITFQPMNLPQFSPAEALRLGTLWPALYSSYTSKRRGEVIPDE
nr:spore coat associated protein CotJA [Paenibacillus roseus]